MSSHGPLEHGKDIVSVSPDQSLHAYQLKVGNVNLNAWRKIEGEVREAATVPVEVPGFVRRVPDRAFLVLTGRITDSVRNQIALINDHHEARGFAPIETIERHELIGMFLEVFSEFFPVGQGSFNDLVRVYLSNGAGPLDKALFHSVLRALVPSGEKNKKKIARVLSNIVVAAEFSSTRFRLAENHISVMDVWILGACRIVSLARRSNLKRGQWLPWLELCHDAIDSSGGKLLAEVNERPDYMEGDPLADLVTLPYRNTIALGYAAAVINSRRIQGNDAATDSKELLATLTKHIPLGIWSEGSCNYYFNFAIAISSSPQGDLAANRMTISWANTVCSADTLESPYTTVESSLSSMISPVRRRGERLKASYSLGIVIDRLCRGMWRQALATLWPTISKWELAELMPDTIEDLFDWVIEEGTLEVHNLPLRGSWRKMRSESFEQRSELFSDEDAWLLPYMLCCYPHRVSRRLSGELDYRTASETARREWH